MNKHLIIGLASAGASLLLVATACSSNTTGTGTSGGTSSGTSGATSSGTTSGATSSGTTSSGGSAIKSCGGSSGTTNCKNGELEAYGKCFQEKCDTEYKKCYGANYASGDFSGGACSAFISCTNACACEDTACRQKCGLPDKACQDCSAGFQTCGASCTVPECATSSSGGTSGTSGSTGKTCNDLKACCAKITDAGKKSTCDQAAAALTQDAQCNAVYPNFAADCP